MAGKDKRRNFRTMWNRLRANFNKPASPSSATPADKQSDIHETSSNDQSHAEAVPDLDARETVTAYQYAPLNESAHEIRFLTILPANFSSEIRVCLDITPFTKDTKLEFEALSYCWGSPVDRKDIFVGKQGNQTIKVTQNLANALPYLRYPDKPRKIWIDAICVNQQDLEERSRQVKRMAHIYSMASRVIIWLGPERKNTQLAIDYCKEVSANILVDWGLQTMVPAVTSQGKHWADEHEFVRWTEDQELAVCDLLKRDWFTRLWIWQEVALATSVVVMCGSQFLEWANIQDVVFYLYSKRKTPYAQHNLVRDVDLLFDLCRCGPNGRFVELIEFTKHANCTDPRDRLFALFSLLDQNQKALSIEPDYIKSTAQVYLGFVQHYINLTQDLGILSSVEMKEEASIGSSWVPNWSAQPQATRLQRFQASGSSVASISFGERGTLQVSGCSIGTIESVESFSIQESDSHAQNAIELERVIKQFCVNYSADEGSTSLQSLSRTLCGSHIAELFSHPFENFPTFQEATEFTSKVLADREDSSPDLELTLKDILFLVEFRQYCKGRSLFRCSEGAFGLAPQATRPGDIVVVWLGYKNAMILRPSPNGHYLLVGEAYCEGAMWGEAFLGPLPEHFQGVLKYNEEDGRHYNGYLDRRSNEFYPAGEDPRLSDVVLPAGWRRDAHKNDRFESMFMNDEIGEEAWKDPRMSTEELEKRGVELQKFILE